MISFLFTMIRLLLLPLLSFFIGLEACFPTPYSTYYPNTYTYPSSSSGYAGYGPYGQYNSKSRMAADTVATNRVSANSIDEWPTCKRRFTDYKLVCELPFERRILTTELECEAKCLENPRCKSFQFESFGNYCDMFEAELQTEDSSTEFSSSSYRHRQRRFILQNGVEPLRTTGVNSIGSNAGSNDMAKLFGGLLDPLAFSAPQHTSALPTLPALPMPGFTPQLQQQCTPSLQSSPGTIFVAIGTGCGDSSQKETGSNSGDSLTAAIKPEVFRGELEPFTMSSSRSNKYEELNEMSPEKAPSEASQGREFSGTIQDCYDGSRATVELIDGISLIDQRAFATLKLNSADYTLKVNRLVFMHAEQMKTSGRCEILNSAISPNGDLNYTPNPDNVYFEKICISRGDLDINCNDVIHRIPQHTLDSRATGTGAVVTASTQLECIRQCINAKKRLGFICSSASHFFDWTTNNCYLSRFTRISRPDIYVAERKELVDYLELPPCYHRLTDDWQHDDADQSLGDQEKWSEWGDCDSETLLKTRTRNCTNCSPKIETIFCKITSGVRNSRLRDLSDAPKKDSRTISTSLENAKRFKPATTKSIEASLFGEQDYENQSEVSFFGPPLTASNDKDQSRHLALKDSDTNVSGENGSNHAKKKCNPKEECCPKSLDGDLKGLIRGCSIGYRLREDGQSEPCLQDQCQ